MEPWRIQTSTEAETSETSKAQLCWTQLKYSRQPRRIRETSRLEMKNDSEAENDCSEMTTDAKYLILAMSLVVICVSACLGNFLVCATVYLHRSLHTVTNLLIVSLACADLFVSIFSMPLRINYVLYNGRWCLSIGTCAFWIWTDTSSCSASIGNLAAVSIERFIAIKYPLRYQSILSKRTAFKIVLFIWLYSIVWASLGKFNWTRTAVETFEKCSKNDPYYYTVISSFAFFLPLAVIVSAYSYLTAVAIQQRRSLFSNPMRQVSHESRDKISRFLHELKATKMMAIVVGAFFLCWFPFFVLLMISLWSNFLYRQKFATAVDFLQITFVQLLPNLNSSLNPVIYIAFTRELRQAILSVLCRFCRNGSRIARRGSIERTSTQSSMRRNGQPAVEMTNRRA